jgi:TrmH family RNA methyltransferase
MNLISSKENSFYKLLKKLKQRKYREKEELFLAEGIKFLELQKEPEYLVIEEGKEAEIKIPDNLIYKTYILNKKLFKEISYQENSQGLILVYKYNKSLLDEIGNNIIVLDRVQDPGNLGTIIRIVDAAGFKDIFLIKGSADIYNEKTVRSSMGSIFSINIVYMEEMELMDFLKEKGYKMIVTALEDDTIDYDKMGLSQKNAIIFGNEGRGVSDVIINKSDEKIKIPLYGSAESLNVAIATGIILYKVREKISKI